MQLWEEFPALTLPALKMHEKKYTILDWSLKGI